MIEVRAVGTAAGRVRDLVTERVVTGTWPVGSRAPSVRVLARELGVNRGIVAYVYQRLIREGVLRAAPAKGTFVAETARGDVDSLKADARNHLEQALRAARLAGYSESEVLTLTQAAAGRVFGRLRTRVAFVECNPQDARAIVNDLEEHLGLPVAPVLLADLQAEGPVFQTRYDLIATSFNHFAEVQAALSETDVVGLQLVPTTDSILEIAGLPPGTRIGVVCHYTTTLDLFVATIRAYQSRIVGGALADDDAAIRRLAADSEVFVVSLFAQERAAALAPTVPIRVLNLVIEPQSLEYMKSRLQELGYVLPLRHALAESHPSRRHERSQAGA